MLHKSYAAKVKAAGTEDGLSDGQFRAVVSVFGNKDSYGDIVMPGAFAATLADWAAKGDPIPVYWSHRMDDPDYCIGQVLEATETEQGLEVLAQLDIDDNASKAKQVYRLLKGRRVTQFSFAYDIDEAAWVEKDDDYWYELRKLSLYEVGPTPVGANQETELLAVKSASEHAARFASAVKAGHVPAKEQAGFEALAASLAAASKSITDVLAPSGEADQEKASASGSTKDEEPAGAKSEESGPVASVDEVLAATIRIESLKGDSA